MTRTTPRRCTILHFTQIFLTDALTFMTDSASLSSASSLVPINDPAPRQVVRRQLHEDLVAGEDADEVLPHLPGDVREHLMLVFQLHLEHRVGQRFHDRRHDLDCLVLGHATYLPRPPAARTKSPSPESRLRRP